MVEIKYLMLYGDVKIVVPEKAKAVYIGTIEYKHDLQRQTEQVRLPVEASVVRDEYDSAMASLRMHIPR
jgi:hypothetical protein